MARRIAWRRPTLVQVKSVTEPPGHHHARRERLGRRLAGISISDQPTAFGQTKRRHSHMKPGHGAGKYAKGSTHTCPIRPQSQPRCLSVRRGRPPHSTGIPQTSGGGRNWHGWIPSVRDQVFQIRLVWRANRIPLSHLRSCQRPCRHR